MNSTQIKTFKLSEDMKKKLDSIADSNVKKEKVFTAEEEFILLEYYEKKNKEELAQMLGLSVTTLRKHYNRLLREKYGAEEQNEKRTES